MPAIDLFEPVVAVLVGMFVLHERIALQGVAPLVEVAGAALAVISLFFSAFFLAYEAPALR